ncbi:ribonuclease HII [Candidatus Woesearchaeota archaeon]|nr:ribonuclease HII [Candidatus Woesearchaeota archaeon]
MVKILGIDEAARGPIIASMYLVGVLGDETVEEKFKQIGVKDSKLLTHKKRCLLESKIKDLALKVKIIEVKPEEIDMAVDGGKLNLNWLEAHKQAEIINELKPDKAIIDCPSPNIKKFKEYLLNLLIDKNIELVVEHKADKNFFIVGAASIIAKCEREKEVAELKKKYGDFGSGYMADPKCRKFVKENFEKHPEIFRKSWAPFKDAVNNKKQKKLDEF